MIKAAEEVEAIARSMLDELFPTAKGIRLLGVTLSSFADEAGNDSDQLRLRI